MAQYSDAGRGMSGDVTDEELLDMAHRGLGGEGDYETFTGDLGHDQECLLRNPDDSNVQDFIDMHGEDNLPEGINPPRSAQGVPGEPDADDTGNYEDYMD